MNFFISAVLKANLDPTCCSKKFTAYIEVYVDGKLARKTESIKNTHEPVWSNETFTV